MYDLSQDKVTQFCLFFCWIISANLENKVLLIWVSMDFFTWLSSPRKTIMIKKKAAHRGEKGIMLTARGYAMKARPGPVQTQGRKLKLGTEKWLWLNTGLGIKTDYCFYFIDAPLCKSHQILPLPRWEHSVRKTWNPGWRRLQSLPQSWCHC